VAAGVQRQLRAAAGRATAGASRRPERALRRIADLARGALRLAGSRLEGDASRARILDPQRTLERGYGITRRADGSLVRSASAAPVGERIVTRLADGVISSRVEGA
jgi:exonuclease VII large subunit